LGVVLAVPAAARADDTVQTIRDDVRLGPPESPSASNSGKGGSSDDDWLSDLPGYDEALAYIALGATAPFWGPHAFLSDDFSFSGYFCRFPYAHGTDYIDNFSAPGQNCPLAVRLDAEYMATFDRLDNMAGHLLVETTPRLGLTASWTELEERLADGSRDTLSLGDCNLVYRFAQAGWGEFRAGCGANWMADGGRADLGFNFTYAADLYPLKPWVFSSELDCGMLGRAGEFRFRSTAGIVLHGIETYVGYEYTDIGRGHWNGLIGGLRLWF
jgi:hypothetical protein